MRGMQCNVEFGYQLSICSKDRVKPCKTLIELAGRRTFRMHTDFYPAVRHLNTRALKRIQPVPQENTTLHHYSDQVIDVFKETIPGNRTKPRNAKCSVIDW
jgi:hypothetical protein